MEVFPFFLRIEFALWAAWVVSWGLAAMWRGKARQEAPRGLYRKHFVVITLGFYLLVLPVLGVPPLWHVTQTVGWALVGFELAGIALTWWARLVMGQLWSGGIETKDGHQVIQTGPFALVRHPIYTGMIMGLVAIALTWGRPTAFLGALLFGWGFAAKARIEEGFLEQQLGGYDEYRRRVPMLVPGLRLFSRGS
jgi:protein-S-isoprenylcysteine O-methyltransferase Ste14